MKKRINIIILIFIFILYMEIALGILLFNKVWDLSFFNIALFSLAGSLFIYFLSSLFSKKLNGFILHLIIMTFTFIYLSQLIYFKTYDGIFSFSAASNANAIIEYFGFVVQQIYSNLIAIFLLLLPFLFFVVFKNKLFSFKKITLKPRLLLISLIIIFHFLAVMVLTGKEIYSNYNLYHNVHSPTLATNKLGLFTTMRLDIKRTLFGFEESGQLFDIEKVIIPEEEEQVIEYNEILFNWEQLINDENNSTIKMMHEYFSNTIPTNKNEHTGLFEGKNLVWFIAESFDYIAIDKEITPTLYKMAKEGFNFTNFYTPVFLSTIDGEYITKTGLLPKSGVWSLYRSSENHLPFTLGHLFRNIDYKTTAYHNGQATYYRRHLSHPNLGYNYYACWRDLNINCNLWPQSDLEMIEATAGDYVSENQPFMTYYLTISGHLRHNRYNAMAIKNWNVVKDLPYSEAVRCYLAQHVELDKALEKLISYLEEMGLAEETVIAISSDHWPYGLTIEQLNEKAENNRDDSFERDRMPFIIWHKGIKGEQVEKLGSSIDILPTLSNLFGLEYDSRLLMGRDLFSDAEPIVIYSNRSWITDKGKYNNVNKQFEPNENEEVEEGYIERINQTIYNRFHISRLILEQDYYRKLP